MKDVKKVRLNFDVTEEALREIDALREMARATTRAELVREALQFYAMAIQKQLDGYELQFKKGSEVQLPVLAAARILRTA